MAIGTTLTDIPIEIVAHIFSHLSVSDISSATESCKLFYEASQLESVWLHKCESDFSLSLARITWSIKDIYQKILFRYGKALGLWQPNVGPYGGVLQVKFDKDRLVATELRPPVGHRVNESLRPRQIFLIHLSKSGEPEVICSYGRKGPHPSQVIPKKTDAGWRLQVQCQAPCEHRHPTDTQREAEEWLREEGASSHGLFNPQRHELLLMKFLLLKQYENNFCYLPLSLPPLVPDAVIQPGVFKGFFHAHGVQLVSLVYEGPNKIRAVKISGDPNVPAGETTFRADLPYSMVLTRDDQITLDALRLVRPRMTSVDPTKLPVQPFVKPYELAEKSPRTPRFCKARFHGFGQIAGHGFLNPSFTRVHWVIFDEDLMAVLWLELRNLSLFHRVKEDL